MLFKHVQDLISKYSFVKGVELKGARVLVYYEKDGELKHKAIPYRADKNMVIKYIKSIKKDINYEQKKKELKDKVDKDMKKRPWIGV
jgi:hypothetical protein